MLIFGFVQIFMSQIPNMHDIKWVSIGAATMSFTYSLIVLGLGMSHVIGICIKNQILKLRTNQLMCNNVLKNTILQEMV